MYNKKYLNIIIGGTIMDRITAGFLKDFSGKYGYSELKNTEQFEYFADYCAIANETNSVDLDLMDMYTGMANQGIDGIAIEINGKYVTNIEEIDELIKFNRCLKVNFVFVQAKTSEEFNNSLILNFLGFVQTFFSDSVSVFKTEEMQKFIELKDYIYEHSAFMKLRNPNVRLYYITCGDWNAEDMNLKTIVEQNIKALTETNLFEDVEFIPFGSKEI